MNAETSQKIEPFDRRARRQLRARAAREFADFSFLKKHLAEDLAERADDFGQRWGRVLDLGAHDGCATAAIPADLILRAESALAYGPHVVCDEDRLPFADGSFDLVMSAGSLASVNDLPGALVQVRRALRKDGVFLASFVGGASLGDIRHALIEMEVQQSEGASPRVHPMVDAREAPALLQRAGFADPVVDVSDLVIHYREPLGMLRDLRGMGEQNVLQSRARKPLTRRATAAMIAAVEGLRGTDGRIAARLEIITMTGRGV
ncbi:class I SAM-dependent methyltransferase [Pacificimonas sp. ICDLI1SI03]